MAFLQAVDVFWCMWFLRSPSNNCGVEGDSVGGFKSAVKDFETEGDLVVERGGTLDCYEPHVLDD